MRLLQRLFGRKPELGHQNEAFVDRIVYETTMPAMVRLPIAQYSTLRYLLRVALLREGFVAAGIPDLLRGHLVGVCPVCGVRLSYEYLEWLAASPGSVESQATIWRRFALGNCVNKACHSTEMLVYWQP